MIASITIDRVVASCLSFRQFISSHSVIAAKQTLHHAGDSVLKLLNVEHSSLVTIRNKSFLAFPRLATELCPHIALTVKDVAINVREFLSSL